MPEAEAAEVQVVAQIAQRVRARFPDTPPEAIAQVVSAALHQYEDRPIRTFVPILVERNAIDHFRSSRSAAIAS